MAWLFFIDESGHDHKTMPYEVRGGFAIRIDRLWAFVHGMQQMETDSFGCRLHSFGSEIKGSTLVDRKRFRFAEQDEPLADAERRRLAHAFVRRNANRVTPSRREFTAYGQACLHMAQGVFGLLKRHQAVVIASAVPRGVAKPPEFRLDNYLRKDYVFLLERFYYLLNREEEYGIIVMDETEKKADRKSIARVEEYFTKTLPGQQRTKWLVPTPFFVSSEMTPAIQAADLCIYCINWGFRLPRRGMNGEQRPEIARMFGSVLADLQYQGAESRNGRTFASYGIVYVPDPYTARAMDPR